MTELILLLTLTGLLFVLTFVLGQWYAFLEVKEKLEDL